MPKDKARRKVLIAATGSVATVKLPLLVDQVVALGHQVKVVLSQTACHFCSKQELLSGRGGSIQGQGETAAAVTVHLEEDEWKAWSRVGDPVLHIDLTKWADILIIAPLSANTMAKIVNGMCDTLLTSLVRAWPLVDGKPILVAPAMNTHMWNHPVTKTHLRVLTERDAMKIVQPVEKKLACGDVGVGAMAPTEEILQQALQLLD
jgi:phosphopantothenoylcysteine decarboxylase